MNIQKAMGPPVGNGATRFQLVKIYFVMGLVIGEKAQQAAHPQPSQASPASQWRGQKRSCPHQPSTETKNIY
jgi:hypothetical protein